MKKKLLLAGVVALMTAAAVTGYTAHSKTGMVDLLSANVEALAQDETARANGPGETVYCASHMTTHVCCLGRNDKACVQTCH